jgi:ATP-dependent RNA helicase RhlE
MTTFESLGLSAPLLKAVEKEGYTTPTPIQAEAIPYLLKGQDLLGVAQTGTGKTAAFSIPILQLLDEKYGFQKGPRAIKALIITPTRELAIQIGESLQAYGQNTKLRSAVIFGGVKQGRQTDELARGVDILVATPGRLLDLIGQKFISLKQLELFVLDEADRMLDMGFVHDVKRIIGLLPAKRQSLFFSATMPPTIQQLANSILNKPQKAEVTPVSSTADTIQQFVYFVEKYNKNGLLLDILKDKNIKTVLVFTRTKHGADKIVKVLVKHQITAEAIHGNKAQNARQRALDNFKSAKTRVLVATDIAARGIDVDNLAHVINYEIPNIPETYVHRIGRTGRAGANGTAYSFCEEEERPFLKDIQKLIGKQIPVQESHGFLSDVPFKEDSRSKNAPKETQKQQNNTNKPSSQKRNTWWKKKPKAN